VPKRASTCRIAYGERSDFGGGLPTFVVSTDPLDVRLKEKVRAIAIRVAGA
jgi:hypothetical protein